MKEQILPKTDAFFEGLPLILINGLTFDDDNRLVWSYWDEEAQEVKQKIAADWPCVTPSAFLKAWYQAIEEGGQQYVFDESFQYPNKAAALAYLLGSKNILYWNIDEEYNSDNSPLFSTEYCTKALSNCFRHIYKFHYKLTVTSDEQSWGFYDDSYLSPRIDGVEYGSGAYKVEIVGHPEETTYIDFGSNLEKETSLAKGTYDLYIYSNQPTLSIDNDSYYTNGCTLTYLESEHCISYVLTATGQGSVIFSGLYGSIENISPDASVTVVKADYDTNLFELSFDRAGQYTVNLFCDDVEEEVRVQDSTNCSFGSRTVKW